MESLHNKPGVVDCPVCHSENTVALLAWGKYSIRRCARCELLFSDPMPTDDQLDDYYQGFLFEQPDQTNIGRLTKKKKKELTKLFGLSHTLNDRSAKRFLDFGGGTGIGFKAITELGFESYYHDIDAQAHEFTKEKFGLTSDRTIEDIRSTAVKFHYIISDNVIEHVRDPFLFILNLVRKLEAGGTLVIKTPQGANTELLFNPLMTLKVYLATALRYNSFDRSMRAFVKRFWHCDPPRHLYSFTTRSMTFLMEKFAEEGITLTYEIGFYNLPWFVNTFTSSILGKQRHTQKRKSIVVKALALLIVPFEFILQVASKILFRLRLISPGGIALRIRKEIDAQ